MMIWQRLVVPAYVALALICAVIGPLSLYYGYWASARFVLGILFVVGSLCSLRAYWYYVEPGPRVNTLVAMLVAKSIMFFLVGAGFMVNALVGPPPETINIYLILAYVCFAAAAGVKFATGLFVLTAVRRNWLGGDVYKWPFSARAQRSRAQVREGRARRRRRRKRQ